MGIDTAIKTIQIDHFINGEFVSSRSKQTFPSVNPATGQTLARVALGGAEEVDLAVDAAKQAFENGPWPQMPIKERCQILRKVGDLILANKERLAQAETLDTGKPIRECLEGDIPRSAQNFHFFADYAQHLAEECYTVNANERHFAIREPLGVAGLITPWNLPLYLSTWKIAPCLAMGNTCVLKPAEWTPYTAFLLAEITKEAGIFPGVFNIVQGYGKGSAGEALTKHPDVACISFTGETSTGQAIMAAAAPTLKKLSFELGGKGANIIFADADLKQAIPTSLKAAFRNQGQICLAGSRLFVEDKIYPLVVEELKTLIEKIKIGNPLDPQTEMGALISKEQLQKVQAFIALGKKEGQLILGGEAIANSGGYFITPALFTGIGNQSKFCQEEIFGPALPVIPFSSEHEVIEMANDTPYGLSASLWSSDLNRCHRVSKSLKTGIVWVNCWFARDLRTPFGGQKASGIGREGGRNSLEFFSEAKTICYRYN